MPPKNAQIAIVDDDASFRIALRRLLAASGFEVETFASGPEFLDSLATRRPDCLLLDLQMPGLTGLEVPRELAQMNISIPTVVITARNGPEVRAQCLASGATNYFSKPVERERLLATIFAALGDRRPAANPSV